MPHWMERETIRRVQDMVGADLKVMVPPRLESLEEIARQEDNGRLLPEEEDDYE